MSELLSGKSRKERLREIVKKVEDEESFSAFGLAAFFDVSLNVIYRDVKALRAEGLIPEGFAFARRKL